MNLLMYYGSVPLGLLENGLLRMQDHGEMLFFILKEWGRFQSHLRHSRQAIDWGELIAEANSQVRLHNDSDPEPIGPEKGRELFVAGVQNSQEWTDFELLLRGLSESGARPSLLSMPIDGQYFERFDVGRRFRDLYYKRIQGLTQAYGVPLVDFAEHDLDEDFLAGHHDH
ncbi:MAG: hypothetical protein JO279_10245, partial [Verrucomicrobia bacterium]|nr:hypothetical protein [Verrucomicrobiota bacterium]